MTLSRRDVLKAQAAAIAAATAGIGLGGFPTRTDAAAAAIAGDIDTVQTHGYSIAGDGGGALYKRVASQPIHDGKFQSADGAWWELAEPIINVLMFGAKGDDTTDNLAAFDAAHNYFSAGAVGTAAWEGGTLLIPAGTYRFTGTWNISKRLTVVGSNSGNQIVTMATRLRFPANTTGIRIWSEGETIPSPGNTSAAHTDISHVGVECMTKTATGHGIHASAPVYLSNVVCRNFAENGINIVAASVDGFGNANQWTIQNSHCLENKNGLYVSGADSNAGIAMNLNCKSNDEWNFIDNSTLGNTYIACHSSDSDVGSYKTGNTSGENIFIGCYVELAGGYGTHFTWPTIVIGGVLGDARAYPFINISGDGSGASATAYVDGGVIDSIMMTGFGSGYTTATCVAFSPAGGSGATFTPVISGGQIVSVTVDTGGSGYPGHAYRIGRLKHHSSAGGLSTGRLVSNMHPGSVRSGNVILSDAQNALINAEMLGDNGLQLMYWNETNKTLETRHETSSSRVGLRFTTNLSTGETGGRSAALIGGMVEFPFGFWIGSTTTARQQTNGTAAPATGEYARGDIVWNRSASAGGFAGWICVTSGTPGTWQGFGATDGAAQTFSSMFRIPTATVAATGSTQGDAAAITTGFTLVTAANATKGVKLPTAVAGDVAIVKNGAAAVLKVWPNTSDAINSLAANASFNIAADTSVQLVAYDAVTWYSLPLVPS